MCRPRRTSPPVVGGKDDGITRGGCPVTSHIRHPGRVACDSGMLYGNACKGFWYSPGIGKDARPIVRDDRMINSHMCIMGVYPGGEARNSTRGKEQ